MTDQTPPEENKKEEKQEQEQPLPEVRTSEIRNVLLATDFSNESLKSVGYARYFAERGAALHILHVSANVQMLFAEYPSFYPPKDFSETVRKDALERLEKIIDKYFKDYDSVTPAIRFGTPFVEIIAHARKVDADLIVISTHGSSATSAIKHILLGSTTERVVRKAPCPVLTVKINPEEFEMP